MNTQGKIIDILLPFMDDFMSSCCKQDRIPYIKKGILNIEAFYWWALVGYCKPDIILESGVAMGRSTEVLSRAQRFYNVESHFAFDINPQFETLVRDKISRNNYKTIYKIADSVKEFGSIIGGSPDKKIVAIVDGPKSTSLLKKIFKTLNKINVLGVGCHDCVPGSKIHKCFLKYVDGGIVTEADSRLSCLNLCIMGEVENTVGDRKDAILRSNHVGLALREINAH